MIIKNPILADAVETCIFDYNNRHFDEPEYDIDFSRVIKNDDESLDDDDDLDVDDDDDIEDLAIVDEEDIDA